MISMMCQLISAKKKGKCSLLFASGQVSFALRASGASNEKALPYSHHFTCRRGKAIKLAYAPAALPALPASAGKSAFIASLLKISLVFRPKYVRILPTV
jgi:hypothetical protein